MKILAIGVLVFMGFIAYVSLGFILGATLCKRHSASWRSWNSNLGEFIMSLSKAEIVTFSIFWPIYLGIGLILGIAERIVNQMKHSNIFKRKPNFLVMHLDDFETNRMYPEQIKPPVNFKKETYRDRSRPSRPSLQRRN